jgi:hypothetical protein
MTIVDPERAIATARFNVLRGAASVPGFVSLPLGDTMIAPSGTG